MEPIRIVFLIISLSLFCLTTIFGIIKTMKEHKEWKKYDKKFEEYIKKDLDYLLLLDKNNKEKEEEDFIE